MTMKKFLLFTSWTLLLGGGHCLEDSSRPKLLVPSATIQNNSNINRKDIHDQISRDFQSYFKLEKHQKNGTQPCIVKVHASGQPNLFKLQFRRNSVTHTCNFSIPLHLDYNGLDNLNPKVFEKLKKFAALLLEHNELDSLNVTISQDSDVLDTLNIDMNNLFTISRQTFRDLKDLKGITLNANNFSAIPLDLFHHTKRLKTIELTENRVNLTRLPPRLFSDLVDLNVVLLRNIGLHELTEDLFWGSHNLKEIDLSNNHLVYLPENLLRDARELRILNVSCNQLMDLPSGIFTAVNQLNQLDLSNNYISQLESADKFFGLYSLQILNMGNNKLIHAHADAFIALPNLRIANFSGNSLTLGTGLYDRSGRELSSFHHCPHLEELHLSGNFVDKIFSDWIFNHTKLRKLDLSGNKLLFVKADDLRFNSSNLYVDLSHNRIIWVSLTQIGHIPKKTNSSRNVTIDLNWNPIYCNCDIYSLVRYAMNETSDWIKPEDLNYVKLQIDNLYCGSKYKRGKRISELSGEVLTCGEYEQIDRLGSSCPYYCFCQIIPQFNMMKIDCSDGRWTAERISIWHIDFAYVDFANNSLRWIPDTIRFDFEDARELYLDLSANQILFIDEYVLTENLRGLVLDGNDVMETDMEMLKLKAPKVITEGLREKSWPCDAAIKDYQKYVIDRFKMKKPVDWKMADLMCPDKTAYFADAPNITNINWQNIHDKISHDFQSYFKLEEYQKNKTQACTVKVEPSGRPDTFKLQFRRNSVTHTCNFSVPLHLDSNGLNNLRPDAFDKLKKFAALLLEHNELDSLNVTISQDSDFLETLNIDMNNLFTISRQIFRDLKDLKGITLNANNFSAIPLDLFHHTKRLKTIELTQNKANLTRLPPRLFGDMVDLKVVILRNIGLHKLTEDLFWGSHNLKEIDLSNNHLRYLPKNLIRDARELRILNLSCNQLTDLQSGIFIAVNQLIQLDLSNNRIHPSYNFDEFAGLRSLQILNMSNNILIHAHADAFIALPNLRIANFSGNSLTLGTRRYDRFGRELSLFHHCPQLEELYLSDNVVPEIFSDWIYNHTKLRKLDLSGNELSTLRTDDLRFNSSNLYVDLRHNQITWVNLTQIGHIPKKANSSRNVTIDLNWNPIYCNCDIYSLVRYVMNETSDWIKPEDLNYVNLKTDNLYCDFKYKRGKRISQLSAEVLTCGEYERIDRLGSNCPYYCTCQIIPKFNMMKIDCRDEKWTEWRIDTWHIDVLYVDLANNSLQRISDVTNGGFEGARELYLDISANQIDRIDEHSLIENLRGLVLDGNDVMETDMEMLKLKAPKVITEGVREKSWPCDAAIKNYQKYAIDRFKMKKPIDWKMADLMCPDKTAYFADA